MPYRYAYLGVSALFVLAIVAFWPSYFSRLGTTSWPLHLHGITATLWMLLLIAQGYVISSGRRALHRQLGRSVFALVPLFTAGGLIVVYTMNAADSPFADVQGPRLGFVDVVATGAFAGLCYAALANRRNVHLHGGYMLATAILLIMPTVTRLHPFDYTARLLPDATGFERFDLAFNVSASFALAAVAVLYVCNRRHAAPFVAIAAISLLQWAGYYLVQDLQMWSAVMDGMTAMPILLIGTIGFLIGAAAVSLGWRAGGASWSYDPKAAW